MLVVKVEDAIVLSVSWEVLDYPGKGYVLRQQGKPFDHKTVTSVMDSSSSKTSTESFSSFAQQA
jgi:hypothetical protein